MNNSYFSSSINDYLPSYDYSFEYSSPSTPPYFYSPLLPPTCPIHSPHVLYTSSPSSSMNISPLSYTYYQPPQQQLQVYSPPVQQQTSIVAVADRTPLRRHQCFKKNELQILHQAYCRDPHASSDVLQQLAVQVKVPVDKVRQWFKNRRHSDKQKKRAVPTSTSS